mgnify:CR=1 FL=1
MTDENIMKKIKTYWWFLIISLPLILLGFFVGADSVIDIPVHDTYYVVDIGHISIGIGLLFFISGCGYLFNKLKFNRILNVLHFVCTLLGFIFILFPMNFIGLARTPRKYYSNTEYTFLDSIPDMNNIITFGVGIILFGILVYLINLGIAIFKNKA